MILFRLKNISNFKRYIALQSSSNLLALSELYRRLESWRKSQVADIMEKYKGKERKLALVDLLDQETQLLRQLEDHRALRSARRRNKALNTFLFEVRKLEWY